MDRSAGPMKQRKEYQTERKSVCIFILRFEDLHVAFEATVNHEDAYDSDVDEGPNAAAAFMANLSYTSATNSQVNEVPTEVSADTSDKCIDTSSASNAIFEINKLRDQLQGKDTTIRIRCSNHIRSVESVGSTEASMAKVETVILKRRSKGRTVADSIAERLTRPTD
ncbi:hypothetical protein Tco_1048026 [Tanacetum coccineum]